MSKSIEQTKEAEKLLNEIEGTSEYIEMKSVDDIVGTVKAKYKEELKNARFMIDHQPKFERPFCYESLAWCVVSIAAVGGCVCLFLWLI